MPDFLISFFNNGNFAQILIFVLILGAAWLALRFVLRLAIRVFNLGCLAIVVLGILLLFINR